ncbi:hypothetical protein PHYBLDRAFT_138152 [Phycomyces blakesleeanus NRRL 1555(-)]|uniref:CHCH domain-containing protein n=1 Tax=Phycomyces blakesleeanus (strain ATCC 8743b / DSM 1359 / FGSC 10004 / NBRC 33097 / NRRL 1555) TaxID=763407 RepID=A0A167R0Z3_PHYB8|nr:hypothetical protein PHYBLDRAFT_138152 [Phycomyces blakesleeanus NRRL 1555(-)]OAD80598.1 hypothetical protein PHYBLDRAFT_138152 [Phycomyces blakesleeanus NRRL 1555(-)]|eukprot:XP_018298638.1 hypothetical protein PHYBLDRAFT_138152 [Phycomyces blakesleeanus NRRL 1555(-)]
MEKRTKGVAVLARGVATCSTQAAVYGQCVSSSYKDIQKDMCLKEFQAFKECVQHAIKRKW